MRTQRIENVAQHNSTERGVVRSQIAVARPYTKIKFASRLSGFASKPLRSRHSQYTSPGLPFHPCRSHVWSAIPITQRVLCLIAACHVCGKNSRVATKSFVPCG